MQQELTEIRVYDPDSLYNFLYNNPQLPTHSAQEYWATTRPGLNLTHYVFSTQRRIWSIRERSLVPTFKDSGGDDLVKLVFDNDEIKYANVVQVISDNFNPQRIITAPARGKAKGRPVLKLGDDGHILQKYLSITDVTAYIHDATTSTIFRACNKEQHKACGFRWIYENDYIAMISNEVWQPIPGLEGYHTSSEGNLRNPKGRTLQCNVSLGYLRCCSEIVAKVSQYVHILVTLSFHGPRPGDNYHAKHIDGNKLNNRAANLEWRLV